MYIHVSLISPPKYQLVGYNEFTPSFDLIKQSHYKYVNSILVYFLFSFPVSHKLIN